MGAYKQYIVQNIKNYRRQRCIKIQRDISLQQEEQQWPQMAWWTLGDFHINL